MSEEKERDVGWMIVCFLSMVIPSQLSARRPGLECSRLARRGEISVSALVCLGERVSDPKEHRVLDIVE